MDLIDIAETVFPHMPGHRPEILDGVLVVTPPPDGPHGESLATTMIPLLEAGLHTGRTRVIQGVGLRLTSSDEDYAVPDLSVITADYRDHEAEYNCFAPLVFRLVLEITANTWRTDLYTKRDLYAAAGIPVYVIGDRRHDEVVVYTDPQDGAYRTRSAYKRGQHFTLPESVGAEVELEVDMLLIS